MSLKHGCELERFLSWLSFPPSGCWIWDGKRTDDGYSLFRDAGRKTRSGHRWIYERLIGKIPPRLEIDHLCRNRACTNPWHMECVTRAENAFRARKKQCKHGHELTPENLYYKKNGWRQCKECVTRTTRERRERKKHAV